MIYEKINNELFFEHGCHMNPLILRARIGGIYSTLRFFSLTLLYFSGGAVAASFDCNHSQTFIEQAICKNQHLSKLDDSLDKLYKDALNIAYKPEELKEEQRSWLRSVRDACQNNTCLEHAYGQRIASLSSYGDRQKIREAKASCDFSGLELPKPFAIYAAGDYSGREINFQIDQSGHQATQMDVVVNSPKMPVVLMLGAYEPTIWNIKWSEATRIVAVVASGYHRQAIAGLDPAIPTLNSSYDNKGPCGYFYVGENDLGKINPMSRRFFGQAVDLVYLAKQGKLSVGEPLPPGVKLITSSATPPESFHDKAAPMAGPAGLEDAVKKGLLRKASKVDVDAWVNAVIASTPVLDVPSIAGVGRSKPQRPDLHNAYVVLKTFTYPAGLYGGNLATFFIPKGIPLPTGNPGHSIVYDFNRLDCRGPLCRE
jgi:uncharacterized protein YecT (DUF1311 family)